MKSKFKTRGKHPRLGLSSVYCIYSRKEVAHQLKHVNIALQQTRVE